MTDTTVSTPRVYRLSGERDWSLVEWQPGDDAKRPASVALAVLGSLLNDAENDLERLTRAGIVRSGARHQLLAEARCAALREARDRVSAAERDNPA